MFTKQERLASASDLKFSSILACTGLAWVLQNIPEAQTLQAEGNLCFGTLDTWILFNLTGGKVHATDYSNISSTGLWDPFEMSWNVWAFRVKFQIKGNDFNNELTIFKSNFLKRF